MGTSKQPLEGIRVLDFSTLFPGPLATLLLAEVGAAVVKVERPGGGDPGRAGRSPLDEDVAEIDFALLNRGKKSVVLDLKTPDGCAAARRLATEADVLVEQFRPGVMARLGLGYEALRELNPRLIYCSISGYGQNGPLANVAAHDLNYMARSGMLGISVDASGKPVLPQGQIADVGGGSFPAVINILLALMQRRQTGRGCYIDVAMAENTFAWMRRVLAPVLAGHPPTPPGSLSSAGGSPRYGVYLALDGVALSVAANEERFWTRFCDLIGLSATERNDKTDPVGVKALVAARLATRTGEEWERVFFGEDVCVERVRGVDEALKDPHFLERGIFSRKLRLHDKRLVPALPVPLSQQFLSDLEDGYPALGDTAADSTDIWQR